MGNNDKDPTARDILSYLLKHTKAEDSIEGIVSWWLLEQSIKRRTQEVQKILDELVREGLILARESKDSRISYRLNKQEIKRIQQMLKAKNPNGR